MQINAKREARARLYQHADRAANKTYQEVLARTGDAKTAYKVASNQFGLAVGTLRVVPATPLANEFIAAEQARKAAKPSKGIIRSTFWSPS